MEWGVGNFLLAFEDANSSDQPIVTDLKMVRFSLDATLNVFAALFLLLAATLIASGRGFAQLGLSLVVSPPLPGLLPRLLSSPGWMLAATCRDFFKRVLLMAATRIAAIESCVCEPGSEYTRLLVVFELVLPCLAGAGMENEFHFTVSETSGPVAGAGAENELQFNVSETAGPVAGTRVENELPDHEIGIVNDFLEDVASRGQARRRAHLVGIGHAPLFQKTKEDKKFCLEILGMMFLERWKVVVLLA